MSNIFKRTHMCGTLNLSNAGQEVVLNGWVAKRRNLGGLIFVDLRDKTGIVQVTFDDQIPQELFERADALRSCLLYTSCDRPEQTKGIYGRSRPSRNHHL